MGCERFDDELAKCRRANEVLGFSGQSGMLYHGFGLHTPKSIELEPRDVREGQDDRQWALRACGNREGALVRRAETGCFPIGKKCASGLLYRFSVASVEAVRGLTLISVCYHQVATVELDTLWPIASSLFPSFFSSSFYNN